MSVTEYDGYTPRLEIRALPHRRVAHAEREKDVLVHDLSQRPPPRVGPADQLTGNVTRSEAAVADALARRRHRSGIAKRLDYLLQVAPLLERQSWSRRKSAHVTEHLRD